MKWKLTTLPQTTTPTDGLSRQIVTIQTSPTTELPAGAASAWSTIRLVGGQTVSEGRVELMRSDGVWGTICDDVWDFNDAVTACRELGFAGAVAAFTHAKFGAGLGPIWLDDVQCDGTETSLAACTRNGGSGGAWGLRESTSTSRGF